MRYHLLLINVSVKLMNLSKYAYLLEAMPIKLQDGTGGGV
jgi:hypothetical protein